MELKEVRQAAWKAEGSLQEQCAALSIPSPSSPPTATPPYSPAPQSNPPLTTPRLSGKVGKEKQRRVLASNMKWARWMDASRCKNGCSVVNWQQGKKMPFRVTDIDEVAGRPWWPAEPRPRGSEQGEAVDSQGRTLKHSSGRAAWTRWQLAVPGLEDLHRLSKQVSGNGSFVFKKSGPGGNIETDQSI